MNNFAKMSLRRPLPCVAPWLAAVAVLVLAAGASPASAAAWAPPGAASSATSRGIQLAGLFGESEEEKAAQQREIAQEAAIASLTQRVGDLEESLRRTTGQVEEANHRADVLQQRMIQMQKDFDYKLCTLTAQQMGAASDGSDANALPCSPGMSPGASQQGAMTAPYGATITGAVRPAPLPEENPAVHLAPPPGVLGTLPAGNSVPRAQPGQMASAPMPGSDQSGSGARGQFDGAMNLLAKAQYDEARGAFRSFADAYPKDDLAPQAVYWVANIAYVQQDYPGAARAFAEEIKKYPSSPRAPESMLKLGQSLIAMKQKEEGCTALGALSSKYPKASPTVLRQARESRKQSGCR